MRRLRAAAASLACVAAATAGSCSSSHGRQVSKRHRPPTPNVYASAGVSGLDAKVRHDPARVYVPNSGSGTVTVIDPARMTVVATFKTGRTPQHVVPSYDLRTLWVNNNGGSLTPIDPRTARPGRNVKVPDPYNMYFTPDGRSMIVVAEARQELELRDPRSLAVQREVRVPCRGVNHLDFSRDGRFFLASCEFGGSVIKVATATDAVEGVLRLGSPTADQPQDVRLAPSGAVFYVADMMRDGVHVIDSSRLREIGFVHTGIGAHGVYPSRDGRRLYVTNRGSHTVDGAPHGPGSISVIDPSSTIGRVVDTWAIPGGGSPDMGNVTADGRSFWVSGRFDGEVYRFDTTTGRLLGRIKVGAAPHGLTVWPQPGRYSLGHTGNMR